LSAIFQYSYWRGIFKFVITYVRHFPIWLQRDTFKISGNFEFQLARFAIFQYGYLGGTFKLNLTSSNMANYAVLLNYTLYDIVFLEKCWLKR